MFDGRLPLTVLAEKPSTIAKQRKKFAQRRLLVERGMAPVIDDDVERTGLERCSEGAKLIGLRLIADERRESLIVEFGEIGQVDADDLAERKVYLPQLNRWRLRLVLLRKP